MVLEGGSKHGDKIFDKILGIGIPDLLMKLTSCNGFLRKINSVVILKCSKRTLKYYFSKLFNILECNINNLAKPPNEVKQRIHAEETDNSEKVMTCINTITSISNTLKNFMVNKSFHYSYIQREFNDRMKIIITIFSVYVVTLLKYINHPAFLQEWKLNLDSAAHERNIDANMFKLSKKRNLSSS